MKPTFDFPMAGVSFTAAIAKKLLSERNSSENATSRLKQIAFITIVFQMQTARCETTYAKIMEVTGLPRASMTHFAAPLLERGFLQERRILNSIGKGHSNELFIPQNLIDELLPGFIMP